MGKGFRGGGGLDYRMGMNEVDAGSLSVDYKSVDQAFRIGNMS